MISVIVPVTHKKSCLNIKAHKEKIQTLTCKYDPSRVVKVQPFNITLIYIDSNSAVNTQTFIFLRQKNKFAQKLAAS